MKTAKKVINDRIAILDSFLEKTKDSTEPAVNMNRGNALQAKGLFSQLSLALEEYSNLLNVGVNNEDLTEKIKELVGQTMSPLVERNKEVISSYKKMIYNLRIRGEEIKATGVFLNSDANGPLRVELNDIHGTMLDYDKAKKDTIEYLEEYETALEEIKEFVIEKEVDEIIDYEEKERLENAGKLIEEEEEKIRRGESVAVSPSEVFKVIEEEEGEGNESENQSPPLKDNYNEEKNG